MAAIVTTVCAQSMFFAPQVQAGGKCRPYNPVLEDPPYCANDQRVNPYDAAASMTGYCGDDYSLTVYAIDNGQGTLLYNISAQTIAYDLAVAKNMGQDVLINDKMQRQVWAKTTYELQFHDYSGSGYDYTFRGDLCG